MTTIAGLSLSAGCNCESDFTDGTCEDLTGRCYCKPNYTGEHCDACAEGYLNFPHCYRKRGVWGRGVARSGTLQTQRVQEGPTAPVVALLQVSFPPATWHSCPRFLQVGTSPHLALVEARPALSWAGPGSPQSVGASHLAGASSLTFCGRQLSRPRVQNGCNGSLFSGRSARCSVFHIFIQPVQLWACQPMDIPTGFL